MQRKVFRVERMIGGRDGVRPAGPMAKDKATDSKPANACGERPELDDGTVQTLKRELASLHDAVAHNVRELTALIGDGNERHMAHAAGKLGAAVEGMEKATEKILKSAEVIDECAKALTATLKDRLQARPGAGNSGSRGESSTKPAISRISAASVSAT